MRDMGLHVYRRTDGKRYIAHFSELRVSPITFFDETEQGVIEKAETWRSEQVENNEAAYIARQTALEKARAARKKKVKADE